MMKRLLVLLFIAISVPPLRAQLQPTNVINFGGGLNLKTAATDIADNESPNMSNMVSDVLGAASQRKGSGLFIEQAYSSFPVTSIYRAYASSGTVSKKGLIVSNRDSLLISTSDIKPAWISISSNLAINQRYTFETMNGRIYIAGDQLANPLKQFDMLTTSMSDILIGTSAVIAVSNVQSIRAKYLLNSKEYMIYGNVLHLSDGTTYYPSRIYYSDFLEPSSVTATRFIDIRADDGQQITGLGNMFDRTHIFKDNSISELTFTTLHPNSTIGDQQIEYIVEGFGCIAPRTLVNIGQYYIFLARDGIRIWDGGRRSRFVLAEESTIISQKIQPIIDRVLRTGTYQNAVGVYYPKKQWYVFSYEDPNEFPKGKNNSVLVYDFNAGNWYSFKNWLAESLGVLDIAGDKGTLVYGSSVDGYIYNADINSRLNDARKEIVVDTMNSTFSWAGSSINYANVAEGTASLKIVSNDIMSSSMAILSILSLGEWHDKSRVSKDDKISFKVYPDSIGFITSMRVDLEMNDTAQFYFDTQFTSVTFSSGALINGNTAFSTVEIPISSFPIRPDWTALDSEVLPFANTLTFYGIRIVLNANATCAISVDDIRVVGNEENAINGFRDTKNFNLNITQAKDFNKLLLTYSKPSESSFTLDFSKNFGQATSRRYIANSFDKEIFVFGYNGRDGVVQLSSVDLSEKISTQVANQDIFDAMTGTADSSRVYWSDRTRNRIMSVDRSSLTVSISSFGSLGTGSTNFDTIHQIAVDDKHLFIVDTGNHRIKKHTINGVFVSQSGSLGTQTTSYHNPTGIAVDDVYAYISDDSNYRIVKITKSSFGVVDIVNFDTNAAGESTLAIDSEFLYLAYNKLNEFNVNFQDVLLEKRRKTDLSLVNRINIKPDGLIDISSSGLRGDIALVGNYIYVSFTDNFNEQGNFYIQKRTKEDFILLKEYKSANRHFGIAGNGFAWKPELKKDEIETGLFGEYLGIRFSGKGLDNDFKLYNLSFNLKTHSLQ